MIHLTEEQENIIESLRQNSRIKIFAYAGTGKTTTLKLLAQSYPGSKFLYLAFNRSIAEEAKSKFPLNTEVYTTHSFALKHVRRLFKAPEIREYKVLDIKELFGIEDYILAKLVYDSFRAYCYSDVQQLTVESLNNFIENDVELEFFAEYYSQNKGRNKTDVVDEVYRYVSRLEKMFEEGYLAISHDFYLKYFQKNIHSFLPFMRKYDVILLDEAQDTNDVTLSIFETLPGKKVMVGDRYQKIYGFRKAIDGMEKFEADKTLRLSTSFRFHNGIADYANDILRKFRWEKVPVKGIARSSQTPRTYCYITRTNGALVELVRNFYTSKTHFNTVRQPEEIFRLPLSLYYLDRYFETGQEEYKYKVKDRYLLSFPSMEDIEIYAETVSDVELMTALKIMRSCGKELEQLKEYTVTQNLTKGDIVITTAHTSKGLEWDMVTVWNDFSDFVTTFAANGIGSIEEFNKLLRKGNKRALMVSEELNLFYVALTRARESLNIISVNKDYLKMDTDMFNALVHEMIKILKKDCGEGV